MNKKISIEKKIETASMRYKLCHKYIEKIIKEIISTPKDGMLWIFVRPIFEKKISGELILIKTTNDKDKSNSYIDFYYEPEWYICAVFGKKDEKFDLKEFRQEIINLIDEAIYDASPTAKYRENYEKYERVDKR